ncbi:TPA: hypothetical protein G9F27_001291 [Salmonella enterica]|uniref:Uncharacterized protein n=1 Tax=Salmonella enterica TaxID=28901 RepID=A0A743SLJ3_SALER|nr:hypothetical protein [Salmonella enterica]
MDGSYVKKKPVHSYELFLKYGGEGGRHVSVRSCTSKLYFSIIIQYVVIILCPVMYC